MHWLDLLEAQPLPVCRFDTSGEDILLLLKPELKKMMARFKGPVTEDLVQQCREFGLFGLLNGSGEGQLALAPLVYARLMRFISFHHPELASRVAHANLTGSYANDSAETAGTPPIHDTAPMAAGMEGQPGLEVMERISTMAIILGQLDLAADLMAEFISIRVIFNRKMVEFELIRTRSDHIKEDILRLEALLFWTCRDDIAAAPMEAHVAYAAFSSRALATIGEILHLFGGTGLMADSGIPGVYTSILDVLKTAAPCLVGSEHLGETMGKTLTDQNDHGQQHRDMNPEWIKLLARVRNQFKAARQAIAASLGTSEPEMRQAAKQVVFQCIGTAAFFLLSAWGHPDRSSDECQKMADTSLARLGIALSPWVAGREP